MPRPGVLCAASILACALLAVCGADAAPLAGQITPRPLLAAPLAGSSVRITPGEPIVVAPGDRAALEIARRFASLVERTRGLELRPRFGVHAAREIVLQRTADAPQGPEGYTLAIAEGRVKITAASDAGLFYATASLWQLMTADDHRGSVVLAPERIIDRPRFAWRGVLLDSARHAQSPQFIERLIEWMALHKLNVLQWHLTDDQGWRLEVPEWPRLTSVGAWRIASGPDLADCHIVRRGGACLYGGYFSDAEVRRIVAFAAARHVTVVPAIEMPGHALAALLAYPQFGSAPPPPPAVEDDWGVFPWLFAPTQPTLDFLESVLTHVLSLFPSPYIAIGGDEAVKDQWLASPAIRAEMQRLGLSDPDALQGWFTARVCAFLKAHGRQCVGWDDILKGANPDATVLSWRAESAAPAARSGHDVVISTSPTLYFDGRQTDLPSEPPGRGHVVSLSAVYHDQPIPPGLTPLESRHIIGVQADLWTEHVRTDERAAKMLLPRAAALSELAWTASARLDWDDFLARLPRDLDRTRSLGLEPDRGALRVKITASPGETPGTTGISLSNQLGLGEIRYTLDGSAPGPRSMAYGGPFDAAQEDRLNAQSFLDGRALASAAEQRLGPPQRRVSQELELCTDTLSLDLEGVASPVEPRPIYLVDIMNPCWIWRGADLDGIGSIKIAAAPLPFNFQLGAEAAKIALRTPRDASGDIVIHLDSCAGPLLADLPMGDARPKEGARLYEAPIAPSAGRHDLCIESERAHVDPLIVLDWVELEPAAGGPGR